mmetsp:Transcript_46634/g.141294  ORF Transcript_46634/g.141294 Transcript_46634/m.141294 type:complete len:80 (+) Transcript_46634:234-473(+)
MALLSHTKVLLDTRVRHHIRLRIFHFQNKIMDRLRIHLGVQPTKFMNGSSGQRGATPLKLFRDMPRLKSGAGRKEWIEY